MKKVDRSLSGKPFQVMSGDAVIICRCEEITKGEIRLAIYDGMRTMNEIKRYLRAGMGLCQGQSCARLVRSILARELGVSPADVEMPVSRAPARPVTMADYGHDNAR